MGYRTRQRILNKEILNPQDTLKKMPNILSHYRNSNQNYPEFLPINSLNSETEATAPVSEDVIKHSMRLQTCKSTIEINQQGDFLEN